MLFAACLWPAAAEAQEPAQPPAPLEAERPVEADPEVIWARIEQEVLPAWEARAETARRRADARRAWFDGGGPFEAAFPDLAAGALSDAHVLRGRLALLDEAGVRRARERATTPPPGGTAAQVKTWTARRAALHQAEEAADELERRLLLGLLAGLELHPELGRERVAVRIEPWRARAAAEPPAEATAEGVKAAVADVARAARELDRFEGLVRALQLSAVAPGAVPDPTPDVQRLTAALEAPGDIPVDGEPAAAAARLELVRPFLSDEAAARVDEALGRWWAEEGLEAARAELEQARAADAAPLQEGRTVEELDQEITVVEAELAAARAELAAAEAEDDAARQEMADLRVQAREARLTTARRHRDLLRSIATGDVASADALQRAQQDAQRRAEEAEEAQASAADARERRRADVLGAVARTTQRTAGLQEELAAARDRAKARHEELSEALAGIGNQIREIERRSTFDDDRPSPDAVYRDVRKLTMELRSDPAARGELLLDAQAVRDRVGQRVTADQLSIEEARDLLEETEDLAARERLQRAITDWERVLADEAAAAEQLVENATTERDETLRALQEAREARRDLSPWITAEERVRDRSYLLEDVGQELALLGPSVVTMIRGRLRALLEAPFKLLDFNVIRGLVVGSFWTFVMVGAWLWARGQTADGARWLTERIGRLRPEMRTTDLMALRDPIDRFLRSFVDLLLGWLLVGRLGALVPEVGFVLLVYLQVALYRALLAFFDLAVVRITEVRPGLVVLRTAEYALARLTVRVFLGFLIARRFALYLLWDVLGLDVITRLIGTGFTVAGIVLLGWALHAWEPALRARIARRKGTNPAVAWLSKTDESAALRVIRSLGILGFFTIALFVDLFYLVARERSSVGRLFNAVTRYRLAEDDKAVRRLPDAVAERLARERTPMERCLERPEVGPAVADAVTYWREHQRQGMLGVVGDRGAGKRTSAERVAQQLQESDLDVTRAYLERRLVTEADMIAWLASVAELPEVPPDPDALVHALEALPPRAWLLEGMHHAFSRRVEGFAAMATLLYVLNASCDTHFWVITMHRPAWDFLASIGSIVDVGVIRTVVRLQPLTANQLRELTVARAEQVGLKVDFSSLSKPNPLGGDPTVDLERAVNLYYRLLAEASDGNPKVALNLFARCLEPVDDAGTVRVHMSAALSTGVVTSLSDAALFALVALRIQDELDEDELVEVTNLPRSVIRSTVRDLLARGLLVRLVDRVRIPDGWLPAVTRTLRRRHFLHLGA